MKYDRPLAQRYDAARRLPDETMRLWLDAIATQIPPASVHTILDVGCGTGRFSAGLADRFDAQVIGVDPSLDMLAQAQANLDEPRVALCAGDAQALPACDGAVDLVFMSMVYHHIAEPSRAGREFSRVLRPGGHLVIRNATKDVLDQVPYLRYFPAAIDINQHRTPWARDLIATMQGCGLALASHQVVQQRFAASPSEYYDKIRRRGLSDLTRLPEPAFQAGLQRMRQAIASGEIAGPVTEPIDLFVLRKGPASGP